MNRYVAEMNFDNFKKNIIKGKLFPTLVGLSIYLLATIVGSLINTGEFFLLISLVVLLILGGLFSGVRVGPDGIYGVIALTVTVLILYVILASIQSDPFVLIGIFMVLFLQALFWGAWAVGSTMLHKKEAT